MKKIKVYYTEKMAVKNGSFSPSSHKPREVIEYWLKQGLPIEIVSPKPLTPEELSMAHDKNYVLDVLSLKKSNGFGDRSEAVAESLPYTSGSMYAAAKEALKYSGVAISPTSGFHHACYEYGGGFCTFNGLVATSQLLKSEGLIRYAGILDCDQHYGNGTDDIIKKLGLDYISHFTTGALHYNERNAEKFLEVLPTVIEQNFKRCDIVLYQAGADCHVDDPLGGWLDSEQMIRRDRIVFETLRSMNIPVAWNFAGGYQVAEDGSIQAVVDIHTNTIEQCLDVYSKGKKSA